MTNFPNNYFLSKLAAVLVSSTAHLCLLLLLLLSNFSLSAEEYPAAKAEQKKAPPRHYYSEPHLGTLVQIAFYSEDKEAADKLAKQCFARIVALNKTFSDAFLFRRMLIS